MLVSVCRYHEENRNLAFGEFRFGPVFMRLCYELGLAELALATLTDQVLICQLILVRTFHNLNIFFCSIYFVLKNFVLINLSCTSINLI